MLKKFIKIRKKTKAVKQVDLRHVTLADVIDIEFLQRFQDNFAKGMGLASVTIDLKGNPFTKPSSYTRFCRDYTHFTECGDKRCAESHRRGGEAAAKLGKPVVYECHAGLIDFAAPIMIDGRLIGTILGGQALTEAPDEAKYRKIAIEIGVDEDEYIEAVKEIKLLSREQLEFAANVLFDVANSMSKTAYQQRKLEAATAMLNEVRERRMVLVEESNRRLERESLERQAVQKILEKQIAQERFLSILSTRLAKCKIHQLGYYIKLALADIGHMFNVSQSFVYLACGEEDVVHLQYYWGSKHNCQSLNRGMTYLELKNYSWLMRQLKEFDQVYIDAAVLPDTAEAERQLLSDMQINSLLLIPVIRGSQLIGFLGLASFSEKIIWQEDQTVLVKVAAELILNVLERQHVFQELRKSETDNRALLESIPDLMLRISSKGQVLRVRNDNKNISAVFQKRRDISELLSTAVAQALKQGKLQKFEFNIVTDGITQYNEARIIPTRDQDVLIVIRDITEQKQAAEALANVRDAIINAQRMASLGVMAGNIAHEINQPLNSIKVSASGLLYLMQKKVNLSTEDFQRELSRIVQETERIDQVISKTRNIVRAGLAEKNPLLMERVIFRVIKLIKDQELFKEIKIDCQVVSGKAWIEGDETQIEQVLFHLLTNAAQALKDTDQAEKVVRISLQVTDQVLLAVTDNGPGLKIALLEKIFEPFFTTGRTAENMGLGLAIVQSIVYAYGGTITAENNCSGGAVFRVCFPLLNDPGGDEEQTT